MLCSKCGRNADEKHFHLGMCQSCYNYFRIGGTENSLPEHGKSIFRADAGISI